MKNNIFEKIVNTVSLDPRIKDGIFNIEENDHMDVFREHFLKRGVDESMVIEFCNRMLEGKYPERQAYNAKGILVTFPTPEYKQAAIQRGTHFEEDPTRKAANVFTNSGSPAPEKPEEKPAAGKTNLPMSKAEPSAPEGDSAPAPAAPAAPTDTPQPAEVPQEPAKPVEPPKEPTELPPPPQKSPEEKLADKDAIKTLLKKDDMVLEEVINFIASNPQASIYSNLMERIKKQYE